MITTGLIIFPFLTLYSLYALPADGISALIAKKQFKKSREILSDSGHIIGIGGHVGVGKTTSTSGYVSFFESYVAGLAYDKIDYVQTIINKMDFTKLNNELDKFYFDEKPEVIFNTVYPLIEEYIGEDEYYYAYDDGIKIHSYEELIKDYIEAYMAIKRNNYVFCNIKFDSVITGQRAFDLKGSDLKIKERFWAEDYRLRRYSVFFYDEATLDPDKLNFNWQQTASDDSGTIEHLRLFRHYFKGKSYYLTTLQNPKRLVKAERELFTSIFMIQDKFDVETFKRIKRIFKIISWINEKTHMISTIAKRILHIPLKNNKKSLYKNIKRFTMQVLDRLNSKDYVAYDIEVFRTAENAEERSNGDFSTTVVYPKKWCYGPIDTYEYSYQYDSAVQKSKVSPEPKQIEETIEEKIKLAGNFLTKKVKSKDNKTDEKVKVKPKKVVLGGN